MTCMVEQPLVGRFANADRDLVDGLEVVPRARSQGAADGGKSPPQDREARVPVKFLTP